MIYLGYDVLPNPPNVTDDPTAVWTRVSSTLDPGEGRRSVLPHDDQPRLERSYDWVCQGHGTIKAMKAWLDTRAGRLVPFWLPTFRRDLQLTADVPADATGITVQPCGFSDLVYPLKGRSHLAFFRHGVEPLLRKITAAVAQPSQESLSLNASLGVLFPKGDLISFLVLVRLASDEIEIIHHTHGLATVRLPYVEVPQETP